MAPVFLSSATAISIEFAVVCTCLVKDAAIVRGDVMCVEKKAFLY